MVSTKARLGATEMDIDWFIRENQATIAVYTDRPLNDAQQLVLFRHTVGESLTTIYNDHPHHMKLHCMLVYELADDCHQDLDRLVKKIRLEVLLTTR